MERASRALDPAAVGSRRHLVPPRLSWVAPGAASALTRWPSGRTRTRQCAVFGFDVSDGVVIEDNIFNKVFGPQFLRASGFRF